MFLTAGDVVVSSVAAAPGVGQTTAHAREPFTVPATAAKLAYMFRENFEQFADQLSDEVKLAGPR